MITGTGHDSGKEKRCGVGGVVGRRNSYGWRVIGGIIHNLAAQFGKAHLPAMGLCLFLAGVTPAEASPWWWAVFSIGEGSGFSSSSSVERYIGQYIRSAQNPDTVYIASFTWNGCIGR